MQVFYFTVRGSADHYQTPKFFATRAGENFVREVLGMEPETLAYKFESWVVNKMDNTGTWSVRRAMCVRPDVCHSCSPVEHGSPEGPQSDQHVPQVHTEGPR